MIFPFNQETLTLSHTLVKTTTKDCVPKDTVRKIVDAIRTDYNGLQKIEKSFGRKDTLEKPMKLFKSESSIFIINNLEKEAPKHEVILARSHLLSKDEKRLEEYKRKYRPISRSYIGSSYSNEKRLSYISDNLITLKHRKTPPEKNTPEFSDIEDKKMYLPKFEPIRVSKSMDSKVEMKKNSLELPQIE